MDRGSVGVVLQRALDSGDTTEIELGLHAMFSAGLDRSFVKYLIPLLRIPSHHSHENIASALQSLRNPEAVDALYEAAHARYDYLNYDEMLGLARKCTWALADIGTAKAKARLEQLAGESNTLVASYASKRLLAWDEEAKRKKGPV